MNSVTVGDGAVFGTPAQYTPVFEKPVFLDSEGNQFWNLTGETAVTVKTAVHYDRNLPARSVTLCAAAYDKNNNLRQVRLKNVEDIRELAENEIMALIDIDSQVFKLKAFLWCDTQNCIPVEDSCGEVLRSITYANGFDTDEEVGQVSVALGTEAKVGLSRTADPLDADNSVLKVDNTAGTTDSSLSFMLSEKLRSEKLVIEYRRYMQTDGEQLTEAAVAPRAFAYHSDCAGGGAERKCIQYSDGLTKTLKNYKNGAVGSFALNQWEKYEIVIDMREGRYGIYKRPLTGDAKMVVRWDHMKKEQTTSPYVLSWDFYPTDLAKTNALIPQYTHKTNGSTGNFYHCLAEFNTSGNALFVNSNLGGYQVNQWNRIILIISPSGSTSKAYLNGKLVYNGSVGVFQKTIGYLENLIFTFGVTSQERTLMLDNMEFYPIYSIAFFDGSQMDSQVKTEWDILGKNGRITGYGPGGVEQFMSLFTYPEGAQRGVYLSDGITQATPEQPVESGMKLAVTSKDGIYTTQYPIGQSIRIEPLQLRIGDRAMSYFITGDATG